MIVAVAFLSVAVVVLVAVDVVLKVAADTGPKLGSMDPNPGPEATAEDPPGPLWAPPGPLRAHRSLYWAPPNVLGPRCQQEILE